VPVLRVPDVLRARLVEPERERVELPLREREVVLRLRVVPDVERRRVVPPVPPALVAVLVLLRRVRAARTFSTPSSIFSSGSDIGCSVELGSLGWLGMSEVLLNG
jgi:hypothetical protein